MEAGTLTIEITRVVVDGRVIESDGKTRTRSASWRSTRSRSRRLRCTSRCTITRRFHQLGEKAGLPKINLHDVRHSYATAGRDAKIDWKALSQRIGHADVAFTMKQYVQTDLVADRQVATTLAALIVGGSLASIDITDENGPQQDRH